MSSLPNGIKIVDERQAVRKLLKHSEPFKRFYAENRPLLTNLKFGTMPHIPEMGNHQPDGIAHHHIDESNGKITPIVLLRDWPVKLSHAEVVAHEMQHFRLFQMGFPMPQRRSNAPRRTYTDNGPEWWMGSMLHEPSVEHVIARYGFNNRANFPEDASKQIEHFQTAKDKHISVDPLAMIFIYVTRTLVSFALDPAANGADAACRWLDQNYPSEAAEAQSLFQMVTQMGFHTPEKMTACFYAIAERYQLMYVKLQTYKAA